MNNPDLKHLITKLLLLASNFILEKDYPNAEKIWGVIYPNFSLVSFPDLYENNENLEDLYMAVHKKLTYRALSEPLISDEDFKNIIRVFKA